MAIRGGRAAGRVPACPACPDGFGQGVLGGAGGSGRGRAADVVPSLSRHRVPAGAGGREREADRGVVSGVVA